MNYLKTLLLTLLLCACSASQENLGSTSAALNIGDSTIESTDDDGNGDLLVAQSATLSEAMMLESLSFYVTTAAGQLRLGVYASDGPSGGPGTKLAETAEFTPSVGWNTEGATAVELSAGTYWLAYFPSSNGLHFRKQPGVTSSKYYSLTYGALPGTFSTTPNTSSSRWSLYATLTSPEADPCENITCDNAPVAACVGGSVRNYSSPGTCTDGACSYAHTDVACPNGCSSGACVATGMPGPLVVSPNPSYFQDTNGRALALFGSHTWNNLQDWGTGGSPQALAWGDYVAFLTAHGHNFTLLWTTELPKFCGLPSTASSPPDFTTDMQPWARTGPGTASDGGLKFDLTEFNEAYFDRLRERVSALNGAGIWTGVYLFSGEWLQAFRCSTDGYPLTSGNNINSVNDGGGTGAMTMTSPNAVTAVQDALVAHTIEILNDLPNVLWIVSEEAPLNSLWWQAHMIDSVHALELSFPFRHPVGVATVSDGSVDDDVVDLNEDWFAPQAKLSSTTTCGSGMPACKVNINDSDHSYFGMWNDSPEQNRQYAWENFARGSQVAFMDPYVVYYPRQSRNLCSSPVHGICPAPDSRWDGFRDTLGYLRSYADRMDLAAAYPNSSLCSTGYCLGHVTTGDTELLVYAPTGGTVTVDLTSAACSTVNYEWFDPATGTIAGTGSVAGGSPSQSLNTPAGLTDSVLFLSTP